MGREKNACNKITKKTPMRIEQVSIKTLTVGILLVIGILASLLSFIAGTYFRESALTAQAKSLSRIIEIASDETIHHIQKESTSFGAAFQSREAVRNALANFQKTGHPEQLIAQLDESFQKGFAGVGAIDLVKLRIYDLDLKLLCESREGIAGLTPQLPPFLQTRALGRRGVERLKTLDGLWISPAGPLYSLLLPFGGIRITGYLEVIVNPTFNLAKVATLTKMPLKIYSLDGKLVYQSAQQGKSGENMQLPVEYLLKAENGEPAYRLVGLENVEQFSSDMRTTQTAITIAFLLLTFSALMLALWAFARFLFRPINHMMNDINRYATEGNLTVTTTQGNAKEFHALSDAFANMAKKIQHNIHELERLSWLDGLTGVANRRSLDTALNREWQRAQRDKTEVSLLMVDIDFFKLYNDHLGHQAGDDCLKMVAATIARVATRPGDLVARYGGEEFAVLLPGTSSEGAASVATHILDTVAALNIHHHRSTVSNIVTLSIGISTLLPGGEFNPYHLVGFADEALYRAKEAGRNQIRTTCPEDLASKPTLTQEET
jgi:diguanylate cyclase (GGDEF)-like protein